MGEHIAIFGAGSWGTALSITLANAGHPVTLWARRAEAATALQKERQNNAYLPGISLPDAIEVTHDIARAARASIWFIATPSQAVRDMTEQLVPYSSSDNIVISLAKGIENDTLMTTTQVMGDVLQTIPKKQLCVLYGPSHAEEVAIGMPTTVVLASSDMDVARRVQDVTMTDRLRVYVNPDVIGVEVGGSVKNVLAIAAGISEGVGFGDNTKAAIVTRGLAEMKRLGLVMGASAQTFAGLSGIGDLVVTCMSGHSRNRMVGERIGQGQSLTDIERSMNMIAEGVLTTVSVRDLARKYDIEMPITEAVHAVLFEGRTPREMVEELMGRSAKRENWLPESLQG